VSPVSVTNPTGIVSPDSEEVVTLKANHLYGKCFLISKATNIIIFSCIDSHRSGAKIRSDSDEMNQHGARKKPAGAMARFNEIARPFRQDLNQEAKLL